VSKPTPFVFAYPIFAHVRKHGPRGYLDYRSFKPWLRDEFLFRCVFCLCRERWFPDGDSSFSVEHFQPKSDYPHLKCEYNNLLLACCACNSAKNDSLIPIDPCQEAFGQHLEVGSDGVVIAKSPKGQFVIDACALNRKILLDYRKRKIALWNLMNTTDNEVCRKILIDYFAYPIALPDLEQLAPPDGNSLPDGVKKSCRALQDRGELESHY
jgi:hypothetical protein